MENYTMSDVFKGLDMLEQDERPLKWDGEWYYTDDDAPFEIKAVVDYKNEKIKSRKRIEKQFAEAKEFYEAERLFGR